MAKKNQPASGGDSGGELLLVFGIGLILFMVWYAYHTKIATLLLSIRMGQSWVISWFTNSLTEDRAWMKYVPRSAVTFDDMVSISTKVGSYIRWVTVPILIGLGIFLFRKSPTERFRRTYTDKTLPLAVASLYPWMRISITNDFSKMDQQKGPWAIALTERQFTRKHKLRNENGEIDRDRSAAVFIKQVGNIYMGVSSMKPHMRALYALFISRANRDFKAGDKLLLQLANSYADGKPNFDGVDALIEKYKDSKIVKKITTHHAYERTLLMSLLERSRGGENGKEYLPPNWFLWLKGVDRNLWYSLADVGRRTPHVESAGVFCHWLTEKSRQKKLEVPNVKNAIDGLVGEMKKYLNDDDDHEGLVDNGDDDLMDFEEMPVFKAIPSPAEADKAFKEGRGKSLQQPNVKQIK